MDDERADAKAERMNLVDRMQRSEQLQGVLRVWLTQREDVTVGAYWAIKGEFDPLPALHRWTEGAGHGTGDGPPRRISLVMPTLLLVPCVGFGPKGLRLGYGGGFYDRTLAALEPRPFTVGIGYRHGYIDWLEGEPHDIPLDAMLTEDGVAWSRED